LHGSINILHHVSGVALAGDTDATLNVLTLISEFHAALDAVVESRGDGEKAVLGVAVRD
jgi:hypothetical protein